jgi:hypothetical protein
MYATSEIERYRISAPCGEAVKILREALSAANLEIAFELNLSERIERKLGVRLAPCLVLLVDTPTLLLESLILHTSAPLHLPVRVILLARGPATEVQVFSASRESDLRLPPIIRASLNKLQSRISAVLEVIAMPQSVHDQFASIER